MLIEYCVIKKLCLIWVKRVTRMSSPGTASGGTTRRRSGRTHNVEDETLSQIAKEVSV